ncbi:prepilin-type N-terminal cleavage/methylation domain-containing protein [Acinetobacter bereziniae]|uniref:prepilin-type N-terminal cleavage/methylation domain-containing protein n=1 Tax=Acinetobacter bereziniae TaxID=106648 RepID=UPI001250CD18|nr:prepilin-type N-terminal cleavage/methylation domain-containing protein [Acinetobacter bereziniae]MBJ9901569.1 prepilin-type N-terminal cleavage/methylation domain-containing protein [Acinetobacter bereziniae]MCU4321484.1 prepilin-type N-terminal cleavage/methylation domain-containing protein [Acinetobacter bereziniae]MCU4598607.1 prepilin-type N-terminal cleavage/methylation domain-containing protein [Acinetobacter bereziniae]
MIRNHGFTFVELLVCLVLLGILASIVIPVAEISARQSKEKDLKQSLVEIRQAIDAFKMASEQNKIPKPYKTESGYPPDLKVLEGVKTKDGRIIVDRFIRRIPQDPFFKGNKDMVLPEETWGQRTYLSDHDKPLKGDDIYDVYSLSEQKGTNGISYNQW